MEEETKVVDASAVVDQSILIDQTALAEDVAKKIPYEFLDFFLVKCLDPIKVKREFSEPVNNGKQPTKDKNGIEAVDYDEVKTEVKEVDSEFRKGVVIKVPYSHQRDTDREASSTYVTRVNVGDVIVFREASAKTFDLLKDSKLVTYYNILAVEK